MKLFFTIIILSGILVCTESNAQINILWSHTYGGAESDGGRSVIQTRDGGYAVAGYTFSSGVNDADVYLIKTDSMGNELWSNTFGGNGREYGNAICQTADFGYIITGYTTSFGAGAKDVYLIKTDSAGQLQWSKTYGGSGSDGGNFVYVLGNDGYLICGYTESYGHGENDIYLIRTNTSGDTLWTKTYGGIESEWGNSLFQTDDRGFLITATTGSFGVGQRDIYIVKTDSLGNYQWQRTFGNGVQDHEWGTSAAMTSDRGYIITGYRDIINQELYDVALLKVDSAGNRKWLKRFGQGTFYDFGRAVVETADKGFIICGGTKNAQTGYNDLYIIKTDSSGNLISKQAFGSAKSEECYSIQNTRDGNVILTGHTNSTGAGSYDAWLVKMGKPQVDIKDHQHTLQYRLKQNYPNPFNPSTMIEFELPEKQFVTLNVYNITGQLVTTLVHETLSAGTYQKLWNASAYASGIYIYRLQTREYKQAKKLLLMK